MNKTGNKLIDMQNAKRVMKMMDSEQQVLVEQLLSQLRLEQQMRLQSEEQHQEMMERMLENTRHLETQLKMVSKRSEAVTGDTTQVTQQ